MKRIILSSVIVIGMALAPLALACAASSTVTVTSPALTTTITSTTTSTSISTVTTTSPPSTVTIPVTITTTIPTSPVTAPPTTPTTTATPTTSTTPTTTPTTPTTTPTTSTTGQTYQSLASQGSTTYSSTCAVCHGSNGQGTSICPVVMWGTGATLGMYNGVTLFTNAQGMLNYMSASMPLTAPGSLTSQQYTDLLAYILLQDNKVTPTTVFDQSALSGIGIP